MVGSTRERKPLAVLQVQVFVSVPPHFQYQKEKLFLKRKYLEKVVVVGYNSFFHFSAENREKQLKKSPCT